MTDDEIELIHSPLTRAHSAEGHSLHIQIYRSAGSPWILEIEDELGTSTVWDEPFETDTAALEAAFLAIDEEGIHHFVTTAQKEAKAAEPEFMRKLAQAQSNPKRQPNGAHDLTELLSADELEELERFLVHEVPIDIDCMTLDELDGFLHAIAIGPETVMPSRWLPKVWGLEDRGLMPPVNSLERANHLLGLVMRHYNSIISHLEQMPDGLQAIFGTDQNQEGEYEDAGMWAHGFIEGVKLSHEAWQPLLRSQKGQEWYRPLQLLGDDDVTMAHSNLLATKEQVEALNQQAVDSVMQMHAYWLPLRRAVAERQAAQAIGKKVGRNEPCPCGSGKKFKKCCGAPSELH